MKYTAVLLLLMLYYPVNAQQWHINAAAGAMHASFRMERLSVSGTTENISVKPQQLNTYPWSGRQSFLKLPGNYFQTGIVYSLNRVSYSLVYQYQQIGVRYFAETEVNGVKETHTPVHTFFNHCFKANFRYSFYAKNKKTRLVLSAGTYGVFSNGNFFDEPIKGFESASGNYKKSSTLFTGAPLFYFNIGLDGGVKVARNIEAGLEVNSNFNANWLYTINNFDNTPNTEVFYSLQVGHILFSAGLYLQYTLSKASNN